jgi:hypothetical protein
MMCKSEREEISQKGEERYEAKDEIIFQGSIVCMLNAANNDSAQPTQKNGEGECQDSRLE